MKIAYIGIDILSPALTALEREGCEILEIFTCETDNVTEFNLQIQDFAKQRGIPLTIGRATRNDLERLKSKSCEAVICGGYYYRLPVDPELPAVNIHPALLPKGRGAWPMPEAILRGMDESGITIHKLSENFDEGDILLQESVKIEPEETLESLTEKLRALLPEMMGRLVSDFDSLWENALPQGEGEYWPCPSEADYPLSPDMDWREADRILRAFFGYECVYRGRGGDFGIIRGRAYPGAGTGENCLPLSGGFIRAEGVRRL